MYAHDRREDENQMQHTLDYPARLWREARIIPTINIYFVLKYDNIFFKAVEAES